MIYKNDRALPKKLLEQLAELGVAGLSDLAQTLMEQAMQIERRIYLDAQPYERSEKSQGHANIV
jgi:hypothetical protein